MGIYYVNSELSHHGVKGMKWGVRNDKKSERKARRQQRKEAKAAKN